MEEEEGDLIQRAVFTFKKMRVPFLILPGAPCAPPFLRMGCVADSARAKPGAFVPI